MYVTKHIALKKRPCPLGRIYLLVVKGACVKVIIKERNGALFIQKCMNVIWPSFQSILTLFS
jgi:hypothetical protein